MDNQNISIMYNNYLYYFYYYYYYYCYYTHLRVLHNNLFNYLCAYYHAKLSSELMYYYIPHSMETNINRIFDHKNIQFYNYAYYPHYTQMDVGLYCTQGIACDIGVNENHVSHDIDNNAYNISDHVNIDATICTSAIDDVIVNSNIGNDAENIFHIDKKIPNIDICFINVGGIFKRSFYPEFNQFISKFDIVCFAETKCDDTLTLSNFEVIHKIRNKYKRSSGGISIAVKKEIYKYVKVIHSSSDYVLWIKVNKKLIECENDLIIGSVYIPPENSPYSTIDAFTELEDDIISKFYSEESILLLGDFNAKTSNKSDLIDTDNQENEDIDSQEYIQSRPINDILCSNNVNIDRKSMDRNNCNNYGYRLLEMCKACNLLIMNRRCEGNDKETGAVTCTNSSMVDYAILYINTLNSLIPKFYVYEYSCLLSDVHSSIHVSISPKRTASLPNNSSISFDTDITLETPQNYSKDETRKIKKLTNENYEEFQNSIENVNIIELIEELHECTETTSEIIINKTAKRLNEILVDSAMMVCGSSRCNKKQQFKPLSENLPEWFNQNCQKHRKEYQKARKKYNIKKHKENLTLLQKSSKQYKKH